MGARLSRLQLLDFFFSPGGLRKVGGGGDSNEGEKTKKKERK